MRLKMKDDNDDAAVDCRNFSNRMALRLQEFAKANGMSMPTLWRRIEAGDVKVTYVGPTPLITRDECVRLGLIS
jgi:hypothetical protein